MLHDSFFADMTAEPTRAQPLVHHQGELFQSLSLRQLPIMKHGPEDDAPFARIQGNA